MGIYSSNFNEGFADELNSTEQELVEATVAAAFYDDLSKMTHEQRQMFLNSEEFKALDEGGSLTGSIGRNTIVKLNKTDDMERRIGQAALNIARDRNDSLWIRLQKNRVQERKLLNQINKKYGAKAERVAKQAQKQYLKTHKIAVGFMRK